MKNPVVLVWHMCTKTVLLAKSWNGQKTHLNISRAKITCEKTFSTFKTSKSLNLSFDVCAESRWEGCKSLSLIAHKTRPGGNVFAICMLASKVFLIAINCNRNWVRYCEHFPVGTYPVRVLWWSCPSLPITSPVSDWRVTFTSISLFRLVRIAQPQNCISDIPHMIQRESGYHIVWIHKWYNKSGCKGTEGSICETSNISWVAAMEEIVSLNKRTVGQSSTQRLVGLQEAHLYEPYDKSWGLPRSGNSLQLVIDVTIRGLTSPNSAATPAPRLWPHNTSSEK